MVGPGVHLDDPVHDLETGNLDPDHERHQWLFPSDRTRGSEKTLDGRMEAMCLLRDYVEDLEDYTATFTFSDVTRRSDVTTETLMKEMAWLVGSWEVPDVYTGGRGANNKRWVNPGYKDREMYSDVVAECECGSFVTKTNETGGTSVYKDSDNHEDDCRVEWRMRAIADLMEKRRFAITTSALLCHSGSSIYDRLHTQRNTISHTTETLGIDFRELKETGYRKRRNTICDLLREGYHPDRVAKVYGISASRLREIVASDTEHDIQELRP